MKTGKMSDSYKEIISALKNRKILVIGDVMLDHYIWGDATRISPEAPVPVVSVFNDSHTVGGAANVALNLASLGVSVGLCGCIGKDDAADKMLKIIADNGIQFKQDLWSNDQVSTIVKTRVIVQKQQLCRIDREDPMQNYSLDSPENLAHLTALAKDVDAVIVSDYSKGVITEALWTHLHDSTRQASVLLAVDPKPNRKLPTYYADLMTPNRKESLEMADIDIEPHAPFPAEMVCRIIWEKYHPRLLVVTLGAEGMLLCEEGKIINQIPTVAQEVFDVSGAGDTVISTLTAALATGANLEDAAHVANAAAGIVVGKLGTATITTDELSDALDQLLYNS